MNPDPQAIKDPVLREDAIVSATLNFLEVDKAPEDTLNRIIWRAMKVARNRIPNGPSPTLLIWTISNPLDADPLRPTA